MEVYRLRIRVSLKSKLFLSMLLIGIFPLVLAGTVGYRISSRGIISEVKGRLEALPELASRRIDFFLYCRWADLLLYRDLALIRDSGDNAGKSAFFREILLLYPLYSWMGLTDPEGRVAAASNPGDVGKEMRSAEWFRAVASSRGIHLEDVSISGLSGGISVVGYSVPCNDLQGRFIGVLHVEVELSTLAQEVKGLRVGETGRALLVRADGVVIADGDGVDRRLKRRVSGLRAFQQALAGKHGLLREKDERGQEAFISFAPLSGFLRFPGFGWSLLMVQNTGELYAPVRKQARAFLLIGLAVFLLILGEGYFLLDRGISRPVSRLTEATRRLGTGDL